MLWQWLLHMLNAIYNSCLAGWKWIAEQSPVCKVWCWAEAFVRFVLKDVFFFFLSVKMSSIGCKKLNWVIVYIFALNCNLQLICQF